VKINPDDRSSQSPDNDLERIHHRKYSTSVADIGFMVHPVDYLPVGLTKDEPVKSFHVKIDSIINKLVVMDEKQDIHHERTTEEHEKLFLKLEADNIDLRRQMALAYAPLKLRRYSLFFIFLSVFSTLFASFSNIHLIHPVVCYFVFGISSVFYIMAVIMEKQDTKKRYTQGRVIDNK
jgi:hypothetical protein